MNGLLRYLKVAVLIQVLLLVTLDVFAPPSVYEPFIPLLRLILVAILVNEFLLLALILGVSILIKWIYYPVPGSPGRRLARLAESVCTQRFYARVLEPVLMDMRAEYFEALREGKPGKAWLLRVYYTAVFWWIALSQVPISILKRVTSFWRIG